MGRGARLLSTADTADYPALPVHPFVRPPKGGWLTAEMRARLPWTLKRIQKVSGLKGAGAAWLARQLHEALQSESLADDDEQALVDFVREHARRWQGHDAPSCPYRVREHAVDAFRERVCPQLDQSQARWELQAACAVAPLVAERPPWVRIAPDVRGHVSEGGYLMLSADIAAAVSVAGEVRTVLTRQSDPGPEHELRR